MIGKPLECIKAREKDVADLHTTIGQTHIHNPIPLIAHLIHFQLVKYHQRRILYPLIRVEKTECKRQESPVMCWEKSKQLDDLFVCLQVGCNGCKDRLYLAVWNVSAVS